MEAKCLFSSPPYVCLCFVDTLMFVVLRYSKHLRSCQNGQLT